MSTTSTPETKPGLTKELVASDAFLLKRLGFLVKEQWHEAFEQTGLQPQHHAVLSILDEGTCTAQSMIADRLDYDRSQIVGLLDDLEERGLVLRKRDSVDRRRQRVTLTPEGHEMLAEFRRISKDVEKEFFAPLDAEERRTLHDLLLRLAAQHDARFGPERKS
jgi:DNA-binding MarR family transcriptional regulator